jgi:protocatechuate 3,4-dioxygenase alpha subunit
MSLPRTPSQTVGPYYSIGLCRRAENLLVPPDDPRALRLAGRLLDGDGEPIGDGLIEVWDAAAGLWGRSGTDPDGAFSFVVARPREDAVAPRLDVFVFARGLLRHQLTRIYFPGHDADEVLGALRPEVRGLLVAEEDADGLRFDIRMQGERQTVFFAH